MKQRKSAKKIPRKRKNPLRGHDHRYTEYSLSLGGADVFRRGSFGAFFKFEFHGLAFGQGAESFHLNFGLVEKTVLPSIIRSDETVTFRIVEPLDFTYHDKLHL